MGLTMPRLLIITNESGKIIATMHENENSKATLAPLAGQHMHRLEDVPIEVVRHTNAEAFHEAITRHFNAHKSKAKPYDPFGIRHTKKR
jgi:hypothetical protein